MKDSQIWVLIVEDDFTSRTILASQLHRRGFEVICAEDGKQAEGILKYCAPDCILLDLIMPRMHGHAFLSMLREKGLNFPVIIMSAIEDEPRLITTIVQLGIQGWISKPVDLEEVIEKINSVVPTEAKAMDL